jgi:GH43 family beta-xylosidase/putative hemolysin
MAHSRAFTALLLGLAVLVLPATPALAVGETTFRNPLLGDGADPWLQYYNGNYYLATTTWSSQMMMRKSPTLAGLSTATPVVIWSDTAASRCCNFWAPEFHRLNGPNGYRWYFMFTAGAGGNFDNQHLVVLESAGDDPMGPYAFKSEPQGTGWNIDGSYLQVNGSLYLLSSAFEGSNQNMWIAKMSNPWTTSGTKVLLSNPTYSWETQGAPVNEGPVVLQRGGKTFLIYSASFCGTPDYKLGMLTLTGSDPLSLSSWTKSASPVLQRSDANGVYGPGHNGFFTSPDGTQSWIVYHANSAANQGCSRTRSTRAQAFTWNSDGTPSFGAPAALGSVLAVPSGERSPITAAVRGAAYKLVSRSANKCMGVSGGASGDGASAVLASCSSAATGWVLDPTADGYYRLVNSGTGKSLDAVNCGTADGTRVGQWSWLGNACQQWMPVATSEGWFRLQNRNSGKVLDVANCASADGSAVDLWSGLGNTCQEWQLQPVGPVAIVNVSSGKVLDVANCASADGTRVNQWSWLGNNCQRWNFTPTGDGYFQISPVSNSGGCLVIEGASTANSARTVTGSCSGTHSQWRIEPLADGTARPIARHSGKALEVAGCSLSEGGTVQQYSWLDNTCQRFHLRPY